MHPDKERVTKLVKQARMWLKGNLGLTLHPKKISIQQIYKGVRFTGTFIKNGILFPSRRLVSGTMKQAGGKAKDKEKIVARMNSRFGLMLHHNTYRLRRTVWRRLSDKNKGFIFINNRKIKTT